MKQRSVPRKQKIQPILAGTRHVARGHRVAGFGRSRQQLVEERRQHIAPKVDLFREQRVVFRPLSNVAKPGSEERVLELSASAQRRTCLCRQP